MTPGVRSAVADTALVAKARRALAAGSLTDTELVAQVLGVSGAPPRVATRLATAMLAEHPEFQRLPDGWRYRNVDGAAEVAPDGLHSASTNAAPSRESGKRARGVQEHSDETFRATPGPATGRRTRGKTIDAQIALPGMSESDPLRLDRMRFAVVDVETTGGSARFGDRITEVAIVPVDGGIVGQPYETLINPGRPIPRMISALTGITSSMVQGAPRFEHVASDVLKHLEGRIFVAHNATFDWRFVNDEVTRALGRCLTGDRLCTVRLTRMLLPSLRRRNLDSISYYFGVENTARHRAGGDAVATAQVLTHLLHRAQEEGIERWPDLIARISRRTGQSRRVKRGLPSWIQVDPSLSDPPPLSQQ